MEKNNWKELEKNEISKLEKSGFDESSNRIKNEIEGNIGVFKFLGDLFELFIPKIFDSIINALGGTSEKTNK